MFKLVRNTFLGDGICKYKDDAGNSVFMRREKTGFVSKLRFADPDVHAERLTVTLPLPEDEQGTHLQLSFTNGKKASDDDVVSVIEDYTALIQHWIAMLSAISMLDERLASNDVKASEELAKRKLQMIAGFEELFPAVRSITEK